MKNNKVNASFDSWVERNKIGMKVVMRDSKKKWEQSGRTSEVNALVQEVFESGDPRRFDVVPS